MQLTTITEQNIALIRFRVEQFVKRMKAIKTQSFYSTNKMYKNLGIANMIGEGEFEYDLGYITESSIQHFNPKKVQLDNYDKESYIGLNLNNYCTLLIKLGDKIKITPTNIFLKENHSVLKIIEKYAKSPFTIISKGDIDLALAREWERDEVVKIFNLKFKQVNKNDTHKL